ncbi:hypothetical protein [Clostridium estertheticum]|nr:hypothetical protein [Clostridium estertheticum]MCB2342615.1 hypothetical protein [Clostridium estertheticum]
MNKRTASERVNKRILNDYNMEEAHSRGKNVGLSGLPSMLLIFTWMQ